MSLPSTLIQQPALRQEPQQDVVVCHCKQVRLSALKDAQDTLGAKSVEDFMEHTEAGTGCRACHCRLRRVLAGLSPHCSPFGAGLVGIMPCTMCGCNSGQCACHAGEKGRCA